MVAQTGVAWGADVDVPVRVQIDRQADVILTNLVLTLQSNQPGALAAAAVEMGADRPLDVPVVITGNHNQGEPYDFTHTLGPNADSIHPCKVYDQSGSTPKGVGRYCGDFGTASSSSRIFGTGRDGNLTVVSDPTYVDDIRTSLVGGADTGATSLVVANSAGFSAGDEALVISANTGTHESVVVKEIQGSQILLDTPLEKSFNRGVVPNTSCPAGFTGEYFNNNSFSGSPVRTQCDSSISFNWGTGGPSGLPSDNFSIRWTGTFHFSEGAYRLEMGSDDGGTLYVDGRLVLLTSCCATRFAILALSEGDHTIRLDYLEYGGSTYVQMSVSVGGTTQVVRVPNYRSVVVQSGGRITAHPWDGTTGGIVAFRASEQLQVSSGGSISVAALGFAEIQGRIRYAVAVARTCKVKATLEYHSKVHHPTLVGAVAVITRLDTNTGTTPEAGVGDMARRAAMVSWRPVPTPMTRGRAEPRMAMGIWSASISALGAGRAAMTGNALAVGAAMGDAALVSRLSTLAQCKSKDHSWLMAKAAIHPWELPAQLEVAVAQGARF